jgi:hypothetical protein
LLGFSDPVLKASLVDEGGSFADIKFSAELLGMFFVAEDVFGATDTVPAGRPPELTCYRRNLFQCSGQITLPRSVSHVVDEEGKQIPIVELVASLTALESIDNRPAEIISIPWKSSNQGVGNGSDDSKTAGAPANIPLDLSSGQELPDSVADSASGASSGRVSVQIGWKRLQFKHATANNGRRKGLQQHYVVLITLLGKTSGGDLLPISEIRSGPVIVRGRSPRNFDSRKDVPLSGDNKKMERRTTNESVGASSQPKAGANDGPPALQRFNSLGTVPVSNSCCQLPAPVTTGLQMCLLSSSRRQQTGVPDRLLDKCNNLQKGSLCHQHSQGHRYQRGHQTARFTANRRWA